MRERIRHVMATTFQLPASAIPESAAMQDVPGWDSLGHLELMLALELEFGVHITAEEMGVLNSLPDIEAYLGSAGAAAA